MIAPVTRFWARVEVAEPDKCWLWTGIPTQAGYGRIYVNGREEYAHRFSYEINKGAIPPGSVVMHSCDNRPCVNPGHLSLGTQRDNLRDMYSKSRSFNQRLTHCIRGHEFTTENTRPRPAGGRTCRACHRIRSSQYRRNYRASEADK